MANFESKTMGDIGIIPPTCPRNVGNIEQEPQSAIEIGIRTAGRDVVQHSMHPGRRLSRSLGNLRMCGDASGAPGNGPQPCNYGKCNHINDIRSVSTNLRRRTVRIPRTRGRHYKPAEGGGSDGQARFHPRMRNRNHIRPTPH